MPPIDLTKIVNFSVKYTATAGDETAGVYSFLYDLGLPRNIMLYSLNAENVSRGAILIHMGYTIRWGGVKQGTWIGVKQAVTESTVERVCWTGNLPVFADGLIAIFYNPAATNELRFYGSYEELKT